MFFHGLGNNVLVINSMKTINDLLEKRGNVYSDRPNFTVVGELMGLGQVRTQSAGSESLAVRLSVILLEYASSSVPGGMAYAAQAGSQRA